MMGKYMMENLLMIREKGKACLLGLMDANTKGRGRKGSSMALENLFLPTE